MPRAGSVLSFRPNPRMPLGHVAVVTRVLGPREIEVDQANWASPGAITREVPVLDVSPSNDWSSVRVRLPRRNHFGSVYVTNGFIYGRSVELGPQIIDVAQALRAMQGKKTGGLPIVIERGIVLAAHPAAADGQVLQLPMVIYTHNLARLSKVLSVHYETVADQNHALEH